MQRAAGKVGEGHIHCRRDVCRLVALQRKRERDVASTIARRILIELLVKVLEMCYGRCGRAADRLQVFRDPGINGNRRGSAGGVI